jgi:hypothetical protein
MFRKVLENIEWKYETGTNTIQYHEKYHEVTKKRNDANEYY